MINACPVDQYRSGALGMSEEPTPPGGRGLLGEIKAEIHRWK
jgi:hypothetical protein